MYKGTISTNTALSSGTTIPYTTVLNTNDNTSASNGAVSIKSGGYYNAQASVVVTGYTASTNLSIGLYANGTLIAESIGAVVGSATNTDEVTVTTPVVPLKIVTSASGTATITAQINGTATATSGILTVQKVR